MHLEIEAFIYKFHFLKSCRILNKCLAPILRLGPSGRCDILTLILLLTESKKLIKVFNLISLHIALPYNYTI